MGDVARGGETTVGAESVEEDATLRGTHKGALTVESGAHLLASGVIVGATDVEPGATLILSGVAQGKVRVADGGRAVISGRVDGIVEATPGAIVDLAGEVNGPALDGTADDGPRVERPVPDPA